MSNAKDTSAAGGGTASPVVTRVRKSVRLHPDTAQRVDYWSRRRNLAENEYLIEAIEEKIARENGDYDLPTLEIQRLNQLIDEVRALSTNQASLEGVVISGFDSMLQLARGDSYLLDDEDGELSIADVGSTAAGD